MRYHERLSVPVSWWFIGLFFALSFVTAVGFYLGPPVAIAAGIGAVIAVSASLLAYGSLVIEVDESGMRAGRAWLDWAAAGEVTTRDTVSTRARLGVDADHRAYLVTRPFVTESVEVGILDPADDHPYWLVSTRHPDRLAEAIAEVRATVSRARVGGSVPLDCPGDVGES